MSHLRRIKAVQMKRINKCLGILYILFSLWLGVVFAQGQAKTNISTPEVIAKVNKDSITIGDKITYTITVKAPLASEVKLPQFAENLAGFAIKDFGSEQKAWWGKRTYKRWYVLDTYTSGTYTIPAPSIKYRPRGQERWQEINGNEVKVEVKSILSASTSKGNSGIRDIAGPVGFIDKGWCYILAVLVVFVLAAVSLLFFKRKRNKAEIIQLPAPHKVAYEALEALKKKGYLTQGNLKQYYIELSDIVRRYLEARFNLRAPEMTTEEFLDTLRYNQVLCSEHKGLLRTFLSHCDLVKFARYKPLQQEANLSFESACRLIDQTKQETLQQSEK
jgi:hypothetical protein